MRRILGILVPAYWLAFFGLLAFAAIAEATGGSSSIFQVLNLRGSVPEASMAAGPVLATGLAFGFTLASVLFLWMTVTVIAQVRGMARDADEIGRMAFGAAAAMMAILLFVGMGFPVRGLFTSASLQLLALLVSYMAVQAEQRRLAETMRTEGQTEITARVMAIGAAHHSMLSRISGRGDKPGREF